MGSIDLRLVFYSYLGLVFSLRLRRSRVFWKAPLPVSTTLKIQSQIDNDIVLRRPLPLAARAIRASSKKRRDAAIRAHAVSSSKFCSLVGAATPQRRKREKRRTQFRNIAERYGSVPSCLFLKQSTAASTNSPSCESERARFEAEVSVLRCSGPRVSGTGPDRVCMPLRPPPFAPLRGAKAGRPLGQ